MSDPLKDAIDKARAKRDDFVINVSESSADKVMELKAQGRQNLNNKLNELPLDKDPLLLARQKEAEALELKAKVAQSQLISKDKAVELVKGGIKGAISGAIPGIPKLPVLDKKILEGVALAKQLKKLYKERGKISRENLSKGKELYSYPITQISPISLESLQSEVPVPEVPKIPNLPFRR
jgi:hypothetical protein